MKFSLWKKMVHRSAELLGTTETINRCHLHTDRWNQLLFFDCRPVDRFVGGRTCRKHFSPREYFSVTNSVAASAHWRSAGVWRLLAPNPKMNERPPTGCWNQIDRKTWTWSIAARSKRPPSNEMGADFSLNSLVSDAWLSFWRGICRKCFNYSEIYLSYRHGPVPPVNQRTAAVSPTGRTWTKSAPLIWLD